MRTCILVVLSAFLLSACGNEEEIAAKKKELDGVRAKFKELNEEKAQKMTGWQEIKNAVIPARKELLAAKSREDQGAIAAAQDKYDAAQSASNDVIAQEKSLTDRITELRDEIGKLEKAIKLLGGKP